MCIRDSASPSAFDRINVRRLFLVVEKTIGNAAKGVLFELNDEIETFCGKLQLGRKYSSEELTDLINRILELSIAPFFRYLFENKETETWKVEVVFPEGAYLLTEEYLLREDNEKFPRKILFFPASRGVLINLEKYIESCKGKLTGLYGEFFRNWKNLKNSSKFDELTEDFFLKLFHFRYLVEKEKLLVEDIKAKCLLELKASSSSVRELAPIYLSAFDKSKFLLIEEPEAHLHPLFQVSLAYFLTYLVNKKNFYITTITHSDFFTLAIGNLVKLGMLRDKNPREFERFIRRYRLTEDTVLEPSEYIVYLFKRKGKRALAERIVPTIYGVPPKSFEKITDSLLKMEEELTELLES
jgi:predicted ATPase